jgi:hypothetical protein
MHGVVCYDCQQICVEGEEYSVLFCRGRYETGYLCVMCDGFVWMRDPSDSSQCAHGSRKRETIRSIPGR